MDLSIKLFNFLTVIVPRLIVKQLGIPKHFGTRYYFFNIF